jgi:putative membrane protein
MNEAYPDFWGKLPVAWVAFALAILAIPVAGFAVENTDAFVHALPTVNACLNGTSAILLYAGWRAIKARRISLHWKLMLSATLTSTLFLTFYLIRFALTGVHRYPLDDWTRTAYRLLLGSHTLLAITVPALVGRSLWLAYKKDFARHRKITRITFPIWMYVSVTGVLVYLMLYQYAGV